MASLLRLSEPVMGTVASVHVVVQEGDANAPASVGRVFGELHRLERIFTTFSTDSEISRISRGELDLLDSSPEVIEVMDACTWLEHASDGHFVARRPDGTLDPAGFVKGWAAQRASTILDRAGFTDWYLNLGGDIQTRGTNFEGNPWSVGVVNPLNTDEISFSLELSDTAIATSGTTVRGRHIWGIDGDAVNPFASFSVLGPELQWADAFATTGFVMGESGLAWVEQFPGYHAIAVTHGGKLLAPAWANQG